MPIAAGECQHGEEKYGVSSLEASLRATLMYGLVPVWALAGLADWFCHRRQQMELTAGLGESLLHLLMLAILGAAVLAALLLELNALLLLLLLLLAALAHEGVFWWDLFYASARRTITPLEQWVHSVQFAVPWVGLVGLALLHRDQALAVIGMSGVPADWSLRAKSEPLPAAYVAGVVGAGALLTCLPFAEELVRCYRVARRAAATPAWPPSGRTPRSAR